MKRAQLLKIKAQVSSIWAKGCILLIVCVKPSTDERGTDAELCVSSPHFTQHRRKFVQTFNLLLISRHC